MHSFLSGGASVDLLAQSPQSRGMRFMSRTSQLNPLSRVVPEGEPYSWECEL